MSGSVKHIEIVERYLKADPRMTGIVKLGWRENKNRPYRIIVERPDDYCEKLKWIPVTLLASGIETESEAMEIISEIMLVRAARVETEPYVVA